MYPEGVDEEYHQELLGTGYRSSPEGCCAKIFHILTLHDLTLHQYRLLLILCLAINVVFLVTQVGRAVYVVLAHKVAHDDSFALMLLVAVLTLLMNTMLLRLLVRPRPKLALLAVLLVMVTTVLLVVEFVIYFQEIKGYPLFLGLWIMFISLEVYSAVVYYR